MSLGRSSDSKRAATTLQQLVARVVAEAVVHLLEPVEVDQEDREQPERPRGARKRLVEAVAEERAVREPGQPVVERLPGELLLEPYALADVPRVEDDPADLPVRLEGRSHGPRGGATRRSGSAA